MNIEPIRAISYGAGVQSTALLILAARREIDYRLALFCNVGDKAEHPATLAYFRDVALPYAAAHGLEIAELRRTGRGKERDLYDDIMKSGSRSIKIPVRMAGGAPGRRTCTVDYKIRRIAADLKTRGATQPVPATVALGISIDEYQRMRTSDIPHETFDYPLIDRRMTRADCEALIKSEGIPVPPKSSCYFCPFHSLPQWRAMRRNEPELFAKAVEMEEVLNQRRADLGRDGVWMSNAGRSLMDATEDGGQLALIEDEESCETAGYCHV